LFIDPGRIKRGVLPLEEIGPSLTAGHEYTLQIDKAWVDAAGNPLKESFEKKFKVGPSDRDAIDANKWKVQSPKSETRAPLKIAFGEPLDEALAQRLIQVSDGAGARIDGSIALQNEEREAIFTPAQPWRSGPHKLLIQTTIEDLAGNNIGKSFEVDLFEGVQRRLNHSVATVPFEILSN
jgi:hypothetical protein